MKYECINELLHTYPLDKVDCVWNGYYWFIDPFTYNFWFNRKMALFSHFYFCLHFFSFKNREHYTQQWQNDLTNTQKGQNDSISTGKPTRNLQHWLVVYRNHTQNTHARQIRNKRSVKTGMTCVLSMTEVFVRNNRGRDQGCALQKITKCVNPLITYVKGGMGAAR